jgi:hypothetical protein
MGLLDFLYSKEARLAKETERMEKQNSVLRAEIRLEEAMQSNRSLKKRLDDLQSERQASPKSPTASD